MGTPTYENKFDINHHVKSVIVYLENKRIGEITPYRYLAGWWHYVPIGASAGEIFPSIQSVKKSLEAE